MTDADPGLFRWQFDLVWSLAEVHLSELDDAGCLWEPAPRCWTVRRTDTGAWVPDWEEPEPDPPPATTIGWLSWHIGWWWTETLVRLAGGEPPPRADVHWPGDARRTVEWLRDLRGQWVSALDGLTAADLAAPAPYPWRDRPDRTVAHMVGWVNAELMKNIAEVGQLRIMRAAGP